MSGSENSISPAFGGTKLSVKPGKVYNMKYINKENIKMVKIIKSSFYYLV